MRSLVAAVVLLEALIHQSDLVPVLRSFRDVDRLRLAVNGLDFDLGA